MRISDLKNFFTRVFAGYSILANGRRLYLLAVAVTPGATETSAPAGSIGVTGHATGAGKLYVSDGAHWQMLSGQDAQSLGLATITTTGNIDGYFTPPFAGRLVAAVFTGIDALAQHGSNYLTFSLTNLGQAGAGSTAMLAATDANTTKTTTGSAIGANTPRAMTLHGTPANLVVAAFDRLRFRVAATGTLNNTITVPTVVLVFERNV
jgi:hypothetical protein